MWCERRMQFGFLKSLSVISTFILLALLPYWWYLYTRAIVVCTKLLYNHSHFIIAPQRSIQWLQRSSLTSAEMWPLVWLSTYTVWLCVHKATLNHNITFIINSFNLTERALSVKRALMVIFPHQNEPRVLCCKCLEESAQRHVNVLFWLTNVHFCVFVFLFFVGKDSTNVWKWKQTRQKEKVRPQCVFWCLLNRCDRNQHINLHLRGLMT